MSALTATTCSTSSSFSSSSRGDFEGAKDVGAGDVSAPLASVAAAVDGGGVVDARDGAVAAVDVNSVLSLVAGAPKASPGTDAAATGEVLSLSDASALIPDEILKKNAMK